MKILIDTNIILDYLLRRGDFYEDAEILFSKCASGEIEGCVAAHTILNLNYILRKNYSYEKRRILLLNLCHLFSVQGITEEMIVSGLDNLKFGDFEDCIQYGCAKAFHADYIVSRNGKDFEGSEIPCVTATEMLVKLK